MEIRSTSMFIWLFLTLSATEFKDVSAQCSDGWTRHRGRCFKFFADAKPWAHAEKACMTADAHLASVNSYHEQKFTQQLIQSATNGAPETWIGGFEVLHTGTWLWSDGHPVNYTFWAYKKPEGDLENCMLTNFGGDLRWDNAYCIKNLPFVCARPLNVQLKQLSTLFVLSGDLGPAQNRTHLLTDTEPLHPNIDALRIAPDMAKSSSRLGRCPPGWEEYGYGKCFKFFNIVVPWAEASKRCKDAEGNLASVHSHNENLFLRELIWQETFQNTVTWIGGTDTAHEGYWKWMDGSNMCYRNWASGQPSGGTKQNCLEMNYGSKWQWNDRECAYTNPFVCEKK